MKFYAISWDFYGVSEHERYKYRVEKGILKYYNELEFTRAFHRNR